MKIELKKKREQKKFDRVTSLFNFCEPPPPLFSVTYFLNDPKKKNKKTKGLLIVHRGTPESTFMQFYSNFYAIPF